MCMLIAIVPQERLNKDTRALGTLLMKTLLVNNASRGNTEGTGVLSNGDLLKTEQQAGEIYLDADWVAWVKEHIQHPIIGHVRAVSAGRRDKDGAHPFVVGNIGCAHNGTFLNHRQLAASVDMLKDDPVDSHIFTAVLSKCVGDGDLDYSTIKEAIDKMTGSYALLMIDNRHPEKLWVAAGANPLHIMKFGPYLVLNTNRDILDVTTMFVNGVAGVFGIDKVDLGKIEKIPEFALHTLSRGSWKHIGKLDKPAPVVKTYKAYTACKRKGLGRGTRVTTASGSTNVTRPAKDDIPNTKEQVDRIRMRCQLDTIPYASNSDIALSIYMVFRTRWPHIQSAQLEVMYNVLLDIFDRGGIAEKADVWAEVKKVVGNTPYLEAGKVLDFQCPYPLNSLDTIKKALTALKEARNVSNVP